MPMVDVRLAIHDVANVQTDGRDFGKVTEAPCLELCEINISIGLPEIAGRIAGGGEYGHE